MNHYYYDQLNKYHQSIYQAMLIGMSALENMIIIPREEMKILGDIFFKLRLDHPEIFYVVTFQCRAYKDSGNMQMLPEYLFDKATIKEQKKAMQARVEKLVRLAPKGAEEDKEIYIHDFICSNIRYDKLKKPYSHEIIGPLGHGVGVCEGIAKSVKILCDALGIWCVIAVSEANPEKNIKYRHAWNIIKINGNYFHLDVTFDNSLGNEEIRYDYFNLSDKDIFKDHEPVIAAIPACSTTNQTYYIKKKLAFTKMEDVGKRTLQAAKKGKPLIFQWRGGYLTKDVLTEIAKTAKEAGQQKNKYVKIAVNWPQAVVHIRYYDDLQKDEIALQQANEGEL